MVQAVLYLSEMQSSERNRKHHKGLMMIKEILTPRFTIAIIKVNTPYIDFCNDEYGDGQCFYFIAPSYCRLFGEGVRLKYNPSWNLRPLRCRKCINGERNLKKELV